MFLWSLKRTSGRYFVCLSSKKRTYRNISIHSEFPMHLLPTNKTIPPELALLYFVWSALFSLYSWLVTPSLSIYSKPGSAGSLFFVKWALLLSTVTTSFLRIEECWTVNELLTLQQCLNKFWIVLNYT